MSVQDAENELVTVECSDLSTTFTPLHLRLWEHGGGKGAGKMQELRDREKGCECWLLGVPQRLQSHSTAPMDACSGPRE